MSVNKVILVGRLGADLETRSTNSGTTVANMRLATNRRWKDDQGQQQEDTEWHRVVAFGRTAENCAQYLTKGRQIYVEGRLQTNEWEDSDGNTRYTTEIVARSVQFLSGGQGGQSSGSSPGPAPSEDDHGGSFDDDDIPF